MEGHDQSSTSRSGGHYLICISEDQFEQHWREIARSIADDTIVLHRTDRWCFGFTNKGEANDFARHYGG